MFIYCGFKKKNTNGRERKMKSVYGHDSLDISTLLLLMMIFLVVRCHIPSALRVHAVIGCCCDWVGGVSSETLGHICMPIHAELRQSSGFTGRSWLNCHFCLCFGFSPEVQWQSVIIIMRISRKCDDQSRPRHEGTLSACCIRSCVHLVEVNLLHNHILVC